MSPIIYTPHDCEKPEGNLPAGTLYQCPECDRVWERGIDVFEDDTNLHWWVEEDPRRGVALQKACSQRTQSAPTITPDMVQLAVDTYTDHTGTTTHGEITYCAACDEPLWGVIEFRLHALSMAYAALQDAMRGETHGTE